MVSILRKCGGETDLFTFRGGSIVFLAYTSDLSTLEFWFLHCWPTAYLCRTKTHI